MMQLYEPTTTDFTLNGHVLTDVYNDTVNWEMNKVFELTFDYPLFSPHGSQLTKEMIVTVPVPSTHNHDQGFRINSVTKSMGIVTVHAYHLFWDLNQNFIEDINNVNSTGAEAAQHIIDNTQYPNNFKVSSDLANTANARMVRMSAISALIGDDDNSFITRWGGEFEWDNFTINIASTIGENRGVEFRNGKNLTGYTAEENMDSVVTRIMPIGYDGLLLPEKYVDADNIGNYLNPRIAVIEYSDIKAIDPDSTSTDEGAVPLDEAYVKLRAAAKDEFDTNHLDKPTTTIKLNVVLLENTEEYKGLEQFNKVYPGDTARFVHTDDDVDTTAELTGYTWSPTQQSYLTVTFESATKSAPTFSQTISRVTNSVQSIGKDIKLVSANGQNANTYSQHEPTDSDPGVGGDVWYENDGSSVNMWIFTNGHWQEEIHDATGEEIKQSVDAQFQGVATWRASIDSDLAIVKAKNEQFDASVQSLGTDIATLKTDVTKSVADVGAKADTAIDSANKALTQIGTANSDLTTIKSDMDTVKGTLKTVATSEQLDGVNKTATSAQTLAETNADSIKNTVTKTELTTAKSDWSSAQSTITAGQISTEITKVNQTITDATKNLVSQTVLNNAIVNSESGTKQVISESIANISVGSRNYLPNTAFDTLVGWAGWSSSIPASHKVELDETNKLNNHNSIKITATQHGGGGTGLISGACYGSFNKGDIFKLSFWAKSLSGNTSLHTELYGSIGAANITITNEWERYFVNLTYSNVTTFYFWLNGAGVCLINSPKLESGTQATDWTPAPEDQASVTAVNAIEQTVDGMKQTIADAATKTEVTKLAGQVTSTISSVGAPNLMPEDIWYASTNTSSLNKATHNFYTGLHQLYLAANGSALTYGYTKSKRMRVKPNTNYTFSFIAFGASNISSESVFFLGMPSSGDNLGEFNDSYDSTTGIHLLGSFDPNPSKAAKYTWTFNTGDNTSGFIRLDQNVPIAGGESGFFFAEAQLEEGTVATTYRTSEKQIQSQITQTQSMIDLRVEKSGLLSEINMQAGATIVKSNKLYLDASSVIMGGTAFINAANIKTVSASSITAGTLNASLVNVVNLNASNITTGTLDAAGITVKNLNAGNIIGGTLASKDGKTSINLDSGTMRATDFWFKSSDGNFQINSLGGVQLPSYGYISTTNHDSGAASGFKIQGSSIEFYTYDSFAERKISELVGKISIANAESLGAGPGVQIKGNKRMELMAGYDTSIQLDTTYENQLRLIAPKAAIYANTTIFGGLNVSGAKNAIHVTRDGVRATPAYETTESYLGDIGEAITDDNGSVMIQIDEIFNDTVNTKVAYQVFLQTYSAANVWIEERNETSFIVRSSKPQAPFVWEIKAKRRGYENDRLVDAGFNNKQIKEVFNNETNAS